VATMCLAEKIQAMVGSKGVLNPFQRGLRVAIPVSRPSCEGLSGVDRREAIPGFRDRRGAKRGPYERDQLRRRDPGFRKSGLYHQTGKNRRPALASANHRRHSLRVFAPAKTRICTSQRRRLQFVRLVCFVELNHLTGPAQAHSSTEDALLSHSVIGRQFLARFDSFLVPSRVGQCVPEPEMNLRRERIVSLRDA
jgi:hypothetical protein